MQRLSLLAAVVISLVFSSAPSLYSQSNPGAPPSPVLVLTTAKGVIEIELFAADAPKSVARILELAKRNFYRGQRFHWVQPGVAQFGDVQSRDMTKQNDWGRGGSGPMNRLMPIGVAEISKRSFDRGIVGYAYQNNQRPTDADSQLFIIKAANPGLNGKYAVVGRVTAKSMAVVDKIEKDDMIKDVSVR
jgi:peptidyl-prolyl cis-trans isomerase B (cyclophilin B)